MGIGMRTLAMGLVVVGLGWGVVMAQEDGNLTKPIPPRPPQTQVRPPTLGPGRGPLQPGTNPALPPATEPVGGGPFQGRP